ncbi:MAG: hypothetical protein L0271_23340 [Gemmatimonadetes bacterium]|nr:hypothetical protein [Gemmatimonadota bacterium]
MHALRYRGLACRAARPPAIACRCDRAPPGFGRAHQRAIAVLESHRHGDPVQRRADARSVRTPLIALTAFGSHSVEWEIGVWIDDPWEWRPAISELHETIWWAFREQQIVIAFPQPDLHVDPPVMDSLRRLAGRDAAQADLSPRW